MPRSDPNRTPAAIDRFIVRVLTDDTMQLRLMAIVEDENFVRTAVELAAGIGLDLASDDVGAALRARHRRTVAGMPGHYWLPTAIDRHIGSVHWSNFGRRRLSEPFFEQSVQSARALPLNRFMPLATPLADFIAAENALPPSGFVFHMSRCGSTLAAQMLAAMDDTIVVAEAPAIDDAVQTGDVATLRAMVAALGRDRIGRARHYVVKLDAWHTIDLPLFRRAFPTTPWAFLCRDPVEILVSHMAMRGLHTLPGPVAERLGVGADASPVAFAARSLGRICAAATEHGKLGGGMMIDYRDLPAAVERTLLPHFGLKPAPTDLAALRHAATRNAKAPAQPFVTDTAEKRAAITPEIRAAVERYLAAPYRRIDTLRAAPTDFADA